MSIKVIVTNRKARHEYHILEKYEGGIVLYGSEVKAIREGKANIKEAYVRFIENELYIIGMHIGKYSNEGLSSVYPLYNAIRTLRLKVMDEGTTLPRVDTYCHPQTTHFSNIRDEGTICCLAGARCTF